MSGTALALVVEARRLGLTIRADGDRIKVKLAEKLPPDLANRIKANRAEVLAFLRSLPTENAPRSTESNATAVDGVQDGAKRPRSNGQPFSAMKYLDSLTNPRAPRNRLADPPDPPIPIKWELDDLDKRALLACGILPTPNVDDLPVGWKLAYRQQADRLVRLGVHREHAEAIALRGVLERMLACGDLELPEGW